MMHNHNLKINKPLILSVLFTLALFCKNSLAQDSGENLTPPAPAQSNATGKKAEKKQSLNFEDELVEGSTSKPELFYLFQKKNFNYKRLIKLRENFLPEMKNTSEEVQRVRSQN